MEYSNSKLLAEFAKEMKGNFIDRNYHHSAKAELSHLNWKIIFDNYTEFKTVGDRTTSQIYTRVVSPIISIDNFRFELYQKNIFSSIAKIFGAQDIEIGDAKFDKRFILKTNDELKLKAFLTTKLIDQIESQNKINLQISNRKGIWEEKLPEGEFELSYFIEEPIDDSNKLHTIYLLFIEMLNQLYKIKAIESST